MKKIIFYCFFVIVLVCGLILYRYSTMPFRLNQIAKIDTDVINMSFTEKKDISVIIKSLNNSKRKPVGEAKIINSKHYPVMRFTVVEKSGKKVDIQLYISCGSDGEWLVTGGSAGTLRIYNIKAKDVDNIFKVLQIL